MKNKHASDVKIAVDTAVFKAQLVEIFKNYSADQDKLVDTPQSRTGSSAVDGPPRRDRATPDRDRDRDRGRERERDRRRSSPRRRARDLSPARGRERRPRELIRYADMDAPPEDDVVIDYGDMEFSDDAAK